MWVPSHTGIAGNEKADKYVVLATKNNSNSTINNILISDIKHFIKNQILSFCQNNWNSILTSNKLKNNK